MSANWICIILAFVAVAVAAQQNHGTPQLSQQFPTGQLSTGNQFAGLPQFEQLSPWSDPNQVGQVPRQENSPFPAGTAQMGSTGFTNHNPVPEWQHSLPYIDGQAFLRRQDFPQLQTIPARQPQPFLDSLESLSPGVLSSRGLQRDSTFGGGLPVQPHQQSSEEGRLKSPDRDSQDSDQAVQRHDPTQGSQRHDSIQGSQRHDSPQGSQRHDSDQSVQQYGSGQGSQQHPAERTQTGTDLSSVHPASMRVAQIDDSDSGSRARLPQFEQVAAVLDARIHLNHRQQPLNLRSMEPDVPLNYNIRPLSPPPVDPKVEEFLHQLKDSSIDEITSDPEVARVLKGIREGTISDLNDPAVLNVLNKLRDGSILDEASHTLENTTISERNITTPNATSETVPVVSASLGNTGPLPMLYRGSPIQSGEGMLGNLDISGGANLLESNGLGTALLDSNPFGGLGGSLGGGLGRSGLSYPYSSFAERYIPQGQSYSPQYRSGGQNGQTYQAYIPNPYADYAPPYGYGAPQGQYPPNYGGQPAYYAGGNPSSNGFSSQDYGRSAPYYDYSQGRDPPRPREGYPNGEDWRNNPHWEPTENPYNPRWVDQPQSRDSSRDYTDRSAPRRVSSDAQRPPPRQNYNQSPPSGYGQGQSPPPGYGYSQSPPPGYGYSQAPPPGNRYSQSPQSGYGHSPYPPPGYGQNQPPPPGYGQNQPLPYYGGNSGSQSVYGPEFDAILSDLGINYNDLGITPGGDVAF